MSRDQEEHIGTGKATDMTPGKTIFKAEQPATCRAKDQPWKSERGSKPRYQHKDRRGPPAKVIHGFTEQSAISHPFLPRQRQNKGAGNEQNAHDGGGGLLDQRILARSE